MSFIVYLDFWVTDLWPREAVEIQVRRFSNGRSRGLVFFGGKDDVLRRLVGRYLSDVFFKTIEAVSDRLLKLSLATRYFLVRVTTQAPRCFRLITRFFIHDVVKLGFR